MIYHQLFEHGMTVSIRADGELDVHVADEPPLLLELVQGGRVARPRPAGARPQAGTS